MSKYLLVAISLWVLGSATAGAQEVPAACTLLNEALVRQHGEAKGPLSQTSQLPGRCAWQWAKAKADTIEADNRQQLRDSMRRGNNGSASYNPVSSTAEVILEIRQSFARTSEAKEAFDNLVRHRDQDPVYGTPDYTAEAVYAPLEGVGDRAAWSAQSQILIFQSGRNLLALTVRVKDKPKENQATAVAIATALAQIKK
jgi:hypothetical protein